jgi:dinuclear metal center YbgI/SA1388 family protein
VTATVRDVVAVLEAAYPPVFAASWDAVGLVCGDPAELVHRVVIAVDPVAETVAEALECEAQLLVTHHPLLLRGVHGVPADDPKGGLVHRLVRGGVGLFCVHTNADAANPGVSDALAHALGLQVTGVLDPHEGMRHIGSGRICKLSPPESLATFTRRVREALPVTAWGVRAGGDPERVVRTVAVCGGAGDSLLSAATAARVDVFLTADLRHHPASEHLAAGGPALVDVAHWASEHPWCSQAAAVLTTNLGSTVDVHVSYRRTDPWTIGSAQPSGRLPR